MVAHTDGERNDGIETRPTLGSRRAGKKAARSPSQMNGEEREREIDACIKY